MQRRQLCAGLIGGATLPPATLPIQATSASYSQAYLVENPRRWLFISGQVPADSTGTVPKAFADQCRLVWRNIEAQLTAADMTLGDLVKVTVFLSNRRYRADNTAVRREVLGPHAPALTVIVADIFDVAWLLEIEAIAAD